MRVKLYSYAMINNYFNLNLPNLKFDKRRKKLILSLKLFSRVIDN